MVCQWCIKPTQMILTRNLQNGGHCVGAGNANDIQPIFRDSHSSAGIYMGGRSSGILKFRDSHSSAPVASPVGQQQVPALLRLVALHVSVDKPEACGFGPSPAPVVSSARGFARRDLPVPAALLRLVAHSARLSSCEKRLVATPVSCPGGFFGSWLRPSRSTGPCYTTEACGSFSPSL